MTQNTIEHGKLSRYHLTETSERDAATEMDWVEWRANEFMGAFLAPRSHAPPVTCTSALPGSRSR